MRRVTAAVAALLLVGCGGGGGGSAAGRTHEGATPPAATGAPPMPSSPPVHGAGPASPRPGRHPVLDRRLIRAAHRGDAARAAGLIARGASVRAATSDGVTALVAAAYGNHVEVAELLVAAGANVNRKDRTEQSAYLIATSEVGDDPRLLELTLGAGADVHALDSFDGTGLIRAAERGNVAIVRRLLATDVRVDHVNNLGWTALHEAVILGDGSRRYVRTVRLLVGAGADVNRPSRRDGVRPLQHAERRGYDEVAAVLRDAGAR